jgi:hypothetical protein
LFGGKSQVSSRLYNPTSAKTAAPTTTNTTTVMAVEAISGFHAGGSMPNKLNKTPKSAWSAAPKSAKKANSGEQENPPKYGRHAAPKASVFKSSSTSFTTKVASKTATSTMGAMLNRVPLKLNNKSADASRADRAGSFMERQAAAREKHLEKARLGREKRLQSIVDERGSAPGGWN